MKPELNAKHIPTGPAVTGFLGRAQGSSIQKKMRTSDAKFNQKTSSSEKRRGKYGSGS